MPDPQDRVEQVDPKEEYPSQQAREKQWYDEGMTVAHTVSAAVVNIMGLPLAKGFVDGLCRRQHRTLQQSWYRLIVQCIFAMAENHDEGNTDLRNEASAEACMKIRRFIQNNNLEYMPII